MFGILSRISRASDAISAALAPVDTEGGSLKAPPGILSKGITELEAALKAGTALSPADLPAIIDAVKNLNGKGIDDRKFFVSLLKVALLTEC
jgi:prostaglandin-endoperoxide synthase 2